MMALEESYDLLRDASLLEALNKGKPQKVIDVLYVEIKAKLKLKDLYSNHELDDHTIQRVKVNRQKAKTILERYPNPRISKCD